MVDCWGFRRWVESQAVCGINGKIKLDPENFMAGHGMYVDIFRGGVHRSSILGPQVWVGQDKTY